MGEVDIEFEFEFQLGNMELTETVVDTDMTSAYSTARENIISSRPDIGSITEFEQQVTVERRKVSYHDPPWDDADELEQKLSLLHNVKAVRYSDPYIGAYSPPTFILSVKNGKQSKVIRAIENYYEGFDIAQRQSKVLVRLSPASNY